MMIKKLAGHRKDLLPPTDELSEATYKSVRLDYLTRLPSSQGSSGDIDTATSLVADVNIDEDADEVANINTDMIPSSNDIQWELQRVMASAHDGWVRSVAMDPVTNDWFVTGGSDAAIKVWDLTTLKLKAVISGHILGVRSLAVSPRYPYLFSGSEDKTVRCWDLERTHAPEGCQIRDYHGHVGGIYTMSLHPELDLLFTGGRDQVIRVWDIRSRTEVMTLLGHSSDITSIESQIGDPQIISSSMDSTIRLWDLRKQSTLLTLTHHTKSIRLMKLHPKEATMCSGDSNGNFKQWLSSPGGELLSEFTSTNELSRIINSVSINPNNVLFAGFDDGTLEFYNYVSGKLIQRTKSIPSPGSRDSAIYDSTFDMSGSRLITCEGDKSIKIWKEVE
ncbi:pre-mRNA-splicing factor prp46 [Scheffersomyces spartinae]|uniref:Pre-mRNA-splicing factor PRP46 n=1 Tax=Scheffersomyces spartinae TaxID=45513 RepID=A0A9P7VC14_9ASCO|nr:pre-mRNA-splicing factor prp46 [Scheffersomyces spartinae]KAG7195033.1 pre-mRNA-splicing factor prp46 [Scheffersomyces spartinae]